MKAQGATLGGSVVSGVLASACCLGPLVLARPARCRGRAVWEGSCFG